MGFLDRIRISDKQQQEKGNERQSRKQQQSDLTYKSLQNIKEEIGNINTKQVKVIKDKWRNDVFSKYDGEYKSRIDTDFENYTQEVEKVQNSCYHAIQQIGVLSKDMQRVMMVMKLYKRQKVYLQN